MYKKYEGLFESIFDHETKWYIEHEHSNGELSFIEHYFGPTLDRLVLQQENPTENYSVRLVTAHSKRNQGWVENPIFEYENRQGIIREEGEILRPKDDMMADLDYVQSPYWSISIAPDSEARIDRVPAYRYSTDWTKKSLDEITTSMLIAKNENMPLYKWLFQNEYDNEVYPLELWDEV